MRKMVRNGVSLLKLRLKTIPPNVHNQMWYVPWDRTYIRIYPWSTLTPLLMNMEKTQHPVGRESFITTAGTPLRLMKISSTLESEKLFKWFHADSSKIGCGVTDCGKNPSIDNWYMITVVCLYEKPLSNVVSDIYLEGEACSKCSGGSKCETSSGLCA
ncbi:unnamed protein product [Caenorhabditis nigoni]